MSEAETGDTGRPTFGLDEETLTRARTLADSLLAVTLVKQDLMVAGGPINTEHSFRLSGPEKFLRSELEKVLGQAALVDEFLGRKVDSHVPGRKSLHL